MEAYLRELLVCLLPSLSVKDDRNVECFAGCQAALFLLANRISKMSIDAVGAGK